MLHVWAWRDTPRGTFTDMNPRVSCEAVPMDESQGNKTGRGPISVASGLGEKARRLLAVGPISFVVGYARRCHTASASA